MKTQIIILDLIVLATLFLVSFSCSKAPVELVFIQSKPKLTNVDIGIPGISHGDMLIFKGDLKTQQGISSGIVQGCLITVDIPESTGSNGDVDEDRFGTLIFQFNEKDNIVVGGVTSYQSLQVEMANNLPQIRAITGGTGEYLTARGQLTTIKNADGTYEHKFEIVN